MKNPSPKIHESKESSHVNTNARLKRPTLDDLTKARVWQSPKRVIRYEEAMLDACEA
jgi:hypothetical protein